MLEGEYLELVAQLQEKYNEITSKLESIERRSKEIKKDMISAYGVIRVLDQLIDSNPIGYDEELVVLVQVLRSFLSDSVDEHILS